MAVEHIRLLVCMECKTIEQLPDYEGNPRDDFLLARLVERHPHGDSNVGNLLRVPSSVWNDEKAREQLVSEIKGNALGGGLGDAAYEVIDTFREDAMTCWQRHQRNPACNEYKSREKRLTPDTAAERKAAGLPLYRSNKDRYLCEFCPVHSLVLQVQREKAGLYK